MPSSHRVPQLIVGKGFGRVNNQTIAGRGAAGCGRRRSAGGLYWDQRRRVGSGPDPRSRTVEGQGCQVATVADRGEAWVIEVMRRQAGPAPAGGLGIGDDAAVLPLPAGRLLVSQDMLVEGVHFRRDWMPPELIGAKAVAANVSDIAAMGGHPLACVVALALPGSLTAAWLETLLAGLARQAREAGAPVVGGDTVGSPAGLVIDIAILGLALEDPVERRGAAPGDCLVVTGALGGSAAGLACFQKGAAWPGAARWEAAALRRHACPPVRVAAGRVLGAYAHAMTDISDAFVTEVDALVSPMGLGAAVHQEALPLFAEGSDVARALGQPADRPLAWALFGGEDYELLAAVPPEAWPSVAGQLRAIGVEAHMVGRVEHAPGIRLAQDGRAVPLDRGAGGVGFDHFGAR